MDKVTINSYDSQYVENGGSWNFNCKTETQNFQRKKRASKFILFIYFPILLHFNGANYKIAAIFNYKKLFRFYKSLNLHFFHSFP